MKKPLLPADSLKGLRILLVEDDPDFRELVSEILEQTGGNVRSEASAAAAFATMLTFRPQLLVSDIAMPGEDGYSLMRRIRALDAEMGGEIPAIAVTAFTSAEDRKRASEAGFSAHIGKPVELAHLLAKMGQLSGLARR